MYDSGNTNQITEQDIDAKACQRLWQAVLIKEWQLVFEGPRNVGGYALLPNENWFGTRGFFDVCALAGLDGTTVLERYRAKLATL